MNVKAVLIDIDNTIIDFNASAALAMNNAFIAFGLDIPDTLFETFKRINDGLWNKIEQGEMTRAQLHKVRWNAIFNELGVDFDGEVFEKRFLSELFNSAVPIDGAEELLKYLANKYPVYAASNAFYEQQINRLNLTGFNKYIKQAFVSEKLGFSKPDKKFFDACFKDISCSPAETVMIGDSLSADVEGGKKYGLITCWYNPTGMRVAAPVADFIVNDLREVANIL